MAGKPARPDLRPGVQPVIRSREDHEGTFTDPDLDLLSHIRSVDHLPSYIYPSTHFSMSQEKQETKNNYSRIHWTPNEN